MYVFIVRFCVWRIFDDRCARWLVECMNMYVCTDRHTHTYRALSVASLDRWTEPPPQTPNLSRPPRHTTPNTKTNPTTASSSHSPPPASASPASPSWSVPNISVYCAFILWALLSQPPPPQKNNTPHTGRRPRLHRRAHPRLLHRGRHHPAPPRRPRRMGPRRLRGGPVVAHGAHGLLGAGGGAVGAVVVALCVCVCVYIRVGSLIKSPNTHKS